MTERHVIIVNYNTPELTEAAIKSVNKHTKGCTFHLLDNSDQRPFTAEMPNVEYVDNTHGQLVDFATWPERFPNRIPSPKNNYGSAKHTYSIQLMLDRIETDCVLLDSDILLKRDISDLWDSRYLFSAEVKTNTRSWGYSIFRAKPIVCYVNVPLMRRHRISYFNEAKMWDLQATRPENIYDTGAWFFEECESMHLPWRRISIGDYAEHFGHGSWKGQDATDWLNQHSNLWK